MAIAGFIGTIILGVLYWIGLSINHLVILAVFFASIFFGALVIADDGEEKRENMYNDFGKPAKKLPNEK